MKNFYFLKTHSNILLRNVNCKRGPTSGKLMRLSQEEIGQYRNPGDFEGTQHNSGYYWVTKLKAYTPIGRANVQKQ